MKLKDRKGRVEWIKAALDQYEGTLVRYAARFTGDLDRARDIVQDTFLKLCSQDRTKVENHLGAWLFTVCRNRALDVLAKEKKMSPIDQADLEVMPAALPSPSEAASTNEAAGQVLRLVSTLPPRQKEVVLLKFQEDLSYKEISQVMNTTVSNVGALLHAALTSLRDRLDHEPGRAGNHGGRQS